MTDWLRTVRNRFKGVAKIITWSAIGSISWTLLVELFKERILSSINKYIDDHSESGMTALAHALVFIVDHAIQIAILVFVFVVSGILIHAYRQSLKERSKEEKQTDIAAKYVRKAFLSRNPFEGLAAKINRQAGGRSPASHFDLLLEIHVVNRTNRTRTIQRIEAEAEISQKWVPLRESSLDLYEIAFDDNKGFASGGLRDVMARKEFLSSLKEKLHEVPLHQGIGVQGWLAFEVIAENDDLEGKPMPLKVTLVDLMEGRHPVRTIEALNSEGRVVYRSLRQ